MQLILFFLNISFAEEMISSSIEDNSTSVYPLYIVNDSIFTNQDLIVFKEIVSFAYEEDLLDLPDTKDPKYEESLSEIYIIGISCKELFEQRDPQSFTLVKKLMLEDSNFEKDSPQEAALLVLRFYFYVVQAAMSEDEKFFSEEKYLETLAKTNKQDTLYKVNNIVVDINFNPELINKILNGEEDFKSAAKKHSTASNAKQGGEISEINYYGLPTIYRDVVLNMEVNACSKIEHKGKIHLIFLSSKRVIPYLIKHYHVYEICVPLLSSHKESLEIINELAQDENNFVDKGFVNRRLLPTYLSKLSKTPINTCSEAFYEKENGCFYIFKYTEVSEVDLRSSILQEDAYLFSGVELSIREVKDTALKNVFIKKVDRI